jgi:hypothetical protein
MNTTTRQVPMSAMQPHHMAVAPMQMMLEPIVVPQCLFPVHRMAQHMPRLPRQRLHSGVRRHPVAVCSLTRNMAHSPARNRRDHFQQVPRLRIVVESTCNLGYSFGQMGSRASHRARNLRQQPFRSRRHCSRHYRQQFAGGHPYQRQEVLSSFVFRLRFGRQLPQVLHHGVGINLAHRTHFVFEFIFKLAFEFVLIFTLAKQAAQHVADRAEFVLELIFVFEFILVEPALESHFILAFKLIFEFEFIFQLVRHVAPPADHRGDSRLSPVSSLQ